MKQLRWQILVVLVTLGIVAVLLFSQQSPVNNGPIVPLPEQGGVYTEGPRQSIDFIPPFLKSSLGFLGMTDVTVLRVEGTSMPGIQEKALEKAIGAIAV